ncbi:MAG: ribonuclease III [Flavobacteriales bacterium]|nr:ribonuclease III [Flavobacteriales bacterium]
MRTFLGNLKGVFRQRDLSHNIRFLNQRFNIRIKDQRLYDLALVHRSSAENKDNERLELLGDAVLDLIVADFLYKDFPTLNEGELTKLKAKIISRDQLNSIGHQYGLVDELELVKQKDLDPSLIIGNVLEAIFGAMYLDQGYTLTHRAAIAMFKETCDVPLMLENLHDAKSLLLEWSQKKKKALNFRVRPKPDGRFKASIYIGDMLIAQGEGRSKKKAEKEAAKRALAVIEILE